MALMGYDLRPAVETFECAGCRVSVVDPAGILAAARTQRVDLLHGAVFPAPVRDVRFTVAVGVVNGRPAHLFDADIRTRPDTAGRAGVVGAPMLGKDPLGVLLARRLAAGDPWTARIVDGVGNAAATATRLLSRGRPAQPSVVRESPYRPARTVEMAGLRATVEYGPRPGSAGGSAGTVAVRAVADENAVSAAQIKAAFCLVLQIVGELVGSLRGPAEAERHYVLSRYPTAHLAESDAGQTISLDNVGGLTDVVAQFRQIAVSFRYPDVMARWGARRPQGLLMYGPPGTGKTMLARALANEIGADFREIRTPEILDKWLGASERNIKRIFRDARRYRSATVLLFDEFDSIISYAGGGSDAASQAVNAVAGIFKQEMNNLIEDNPNVIVVATTNFPHRVDESLIRSGRFDVKLAIPRPDEDGRADIITKMIRGLIARHEVSGFQMFDDDVDPVDLARATPGMTGADLKEVLRRAQLAKAMQEAQTGTAAPPIRQDDLKRCVEDLHTGRT